MASSVQWLALVGYGVLVFLVAPRAGHHRGFLWARSREGTAPSTALLTASVLVTWIFAKSITNAANLGEKYGWLGGLAYAAWYVSIPAAGILLYRVRKAGHEGIIPFLTAQFGPGAAFLFSAAIVVRLYNEVWSNTEVVASYFGAPGSFSFYVSAAVFTAGVLLYTMRGGLRASIFTDRLQLALQVVLLGWVLVLILPAHSVGQVARSSQFRLDAGLDLLLVGLLQSTSYPFHDPVLTDRAFVNPPRKMLISFTLAGLLGATMIVLYGLIGVHARLGGAAGAGDAPLRAAALLGSAAVVVISVLMMNSAGACVDSTFTAVARFASVDLAGEGGAHPSGFRGLFRPLRRLTERDHGVSLGRWTMLAFADARAKVWATQDDRYVFATVAGPEHPRKRLLAMIRGTLHKIFNEYKALSPVEQWEHKGRWVPLETLVDLGALPRELLPLSKRFDDDRLGGKEPV